jgi:hypothetical protein
MSTGETMSRLIVGNESISVLEMPDERFERLQRRVRPVHEKDNGTMPTPLVAIVD